MRKGACLPSRCFENPCSVPKLLHRIELRRATRRESSVAQVGRPSLWQVPVCVLQREGSSLLDQRSSATRAEVQEETTPLVSAKPMGLPRGKVEST